MSAMLRANEMLARTRLTALEKVAAARLALEKAEKELAAVPRQWMIAVVDEDHCRGGAHQHGCWCCRARVRRVKEGTKVVKAFIPPMGWLGWPDALEGQRKRAYHYAANINAEREASWQEFLNT